MITEPFTAGNSIVHHVDPRLKIVLAMLLSGTIAVSTSSSTLAAGLVTALLLIFLGRLEMKAVARRLAVVFGLMALIWVVLPFTYPGEPLWRMGPLQASRPGVVLCTKITVKSITILLFMIALIATNPLSALGGALHRLRVPDKLVYLLVMTYRYIFVIANEYQRLMRAARIRGFQPGTNLHAYRTLAYLTGMLFIRASARADSVYRAMVCRGFDGRFHPLGPVVPYTRNLAFGLLCGAAFLLIAGLEIRELLL